MQRSEAAEDVDANAESSEASATKSPHLFTVAMRFSFAAESFPAFRTKRGLLRRELRCAAGAACIIFLVTSARRLASSISSSMSMFGRLPFRGRPTRFDAESTATSARSDKVTGSSLAVISIAMCRRAVQALATNGRRWLATRQPVVRTKRTL